jgi:putative FmdB family regulatory protein
MYEYECDLCHHRFEVIQRLTDPLVDRCPKCGSPVHKLQSAPAFQFKGTGWYVTDYARKDSGSADTKSDDKPKSEEKSKSDGKTSAAEKSDKPAESSKSSSSSDTASSSTTSSTPTKTS